MSVHVIDRVRWGARRPTSRASFDNPQAIFLHHTTGRTLGADFSDDWVRNIQTQHMVANGWADIGYSFLFDAYGNIFEGRGWNVVGGHTFGWNARAHAFCFLGNGDEALTPAALEALHWLIGKHDDRYGEKPIMGHRDANATHCPGTWIWEHRNDFRGRSIEMPKVELVAAYTPAPFFFSDPYTVEAQVAVLPTVQQGDTGQHVSICQGLLVANARRVDVDGIFGPATSAALREWQGAVDLTSDGICGPRTWRRLLCI